STPGCDSAIFRARRQRSSARALHRSSEMFDVSLGTTRVLHSVKSISTHQPVLLADGRKPGGQLSAWDHNDKATIFKPWMSLKSFGLEDFSTPKLFRAFRENASWPTMPQR